MMQYRIWQFGSTWHWQVFSEDAVVLTSGVEQNSRAARTAALSYCREVQHDQSEPC
jgi:hypothetical protein